MAFLDRIRIKILAGKGGDGAVAFRHEKFAPMGGPDGGDGGDGGSVIIKTSTDVQDFAHLAGYDSFKAQKGRQGGGSKCYGAKGEDIVLLVPPGTILTNAETGLVMRDLDANHLSITAARGGKGGRGNARFATATNQAPRTAEKGEPGESRVLDLELRLIADVAIVGLPNAGKSTLLSAISEAHPKIAAYPFTTLYPNLGVTETDAFGRLIVADVPGLIAGAHAGAGLGHEFLRHIERTRCLLHLVDASAPDPVEDYETLRHELVSYSAEVGKKPVLVAASKMDLEESAAGLAKLEESLGDVIPISAASGAGVEEMLKRLAALVSS